MLLVNDVTKTYGKKRALDGVSLDFPDGVHALLAPNGAGKSTLIKLLATLIKPTGGEILYDGVNIADLGADYRDLIGYLPQDFGFYPSYTARRFLRYIAVLKGLDHRRIDARIDEILTLVALSDVANKKLKTFSGGMLQRIGIAQAMLNDPRILILDEPTAGLDPKERARFRNLVARIARDRIVILSTHIVSDIETIADWVVLLREGEVVTRDRPEAIRGSLDGRVFETPTLALLRNSDLLVAERRENDTTVYRFVSGGQGAAGVAVPPNLEDVFLATFRDAS